MTARSYVHSWGRWHILDRVDAGGWHAVCGLLADYDDPVSDRLPDGEHVHEVCQRLTAAAAAEQDSPEGTT